jgi:hypothetical protein
LRVNLVGFSDEKFEALLTEPESEHAGLTDEDAVPEQQENVITVPGDVWILRQHRLLCGDSTQLADVEKVMAGGLADVTFCDPPYEVNYGASMKDKLRGKHRPIANDNLGDDFGPCLLEACKNILALTKGAVYICMSSSELDRLQKAFREAGDHWSTFVIWAKNVFTMGRSDYQRQYEPILYGWREGSAHYWVWRAGSGRWCGSSTSRTATIFIRLRSRSISRAGDPQRIEVARYSVRSVRRVWLDAHRVREVGAAGG